MGIAWLPCKRPIIYNDSLEIVGHLIPNKNLSNSRYDWTIEVYNRKDLANLKEAREDFSASVKITFRYVPLEPSQEKEPFIQNSE